MAADEGIRRWQQLAGVSRQAGISNRAMAKKVGRIQCKLEATGGLYQLA